MERKYRVFERTWDNIIVSCSGSITLDVATLVLDRNYIDGYRRVNGITIKAFILYDISFWHIAMSYSGPGNFKSKLENL